MYKDPDKQREAVKMATRRYRAKGITKVSYTSQVVVPKECESVIPLQSHNPMMVGYVPPQD